MKKVFLVTVVALLTVAMLVLPVPAAFATPSTEITGTTTMLNPMAYVTMRDLGDSGMQIFTFTNAPFEIHGDIEGTGLYYGVWLMKPSVGFSPFELVVAKGVYYLDVEVNGARGELTLCMPTNMKMIIMGGTGDLKNLHGTGLLTPIPDTMGLEYAYSMDVHFDP